MPGQVTGKKESTNLVEEKPTPRCWNCKRCKYVYYTGRFHCSGRKQPLLRNMIPMFVCRLHEYHSVNAIAHRRLALWHTILDSEELKKFSPKESYLSRLADAAASRAKNF
jgi:hypothetical protein